ncbi:MAG: phosphatidate cytidylyltransferase [Planctomycetaceae bacterium]|nr:phosphatidate cytidylyltransferase [Planctomycetaceae bacterium]
MLGWRLFLSSLIVPTLVGLMVWDAHLGASAPVLFVLCLLVGLRASWELLALVRRESCDPKYGPVACCVTLLLLATWGPHWLNVADTSELITWSFPSLSQVFVACMLVLLVTRVFRFRQPGGHVEGLAFELLAVTYAGLLLAVTAQLRWLGNGGNGYLALGSVIVATKMGDIGAYSLGRMFGKRKMAPHLSPGKTWMGAVGAVLGGVLGAILWLRFASELLFGLTWKPNWWMPAVLFGAAMGIVGLFGDLAESLIKRDVGVKDSATLMPGFGGLLDLLDSVLFTGPVAVVLWQLFLGTHHP